MRGIGFAAGIILLIAGVVWVLQGLNIVRGSFMSGQAFWGWTGLLCVIVGLGLLYLAARGQARTR